MKSPVWKGESEIDSRVLNDLVPAPEAEFRILDIIISQTLVHRIQFRNFRHTYFIIFTFHYRIGGIVKLMIILNF